jgi:hypothetical protein
MFAFLCIFTYLFLLCNLFGDTQYLDHRMNDYEYGALVEWRKGKTPVPVPRGVSKDRIRTSEVRIPELAAYSHDLVSEVVDLLFCFCFGEFFSPPKRVTLHAVWVETVKC